MQEDGELVGFDIDLLEAVVDETEYELGEWATFEFDSLIPALTQNEGDRRDRRRDDDHRGPPGDDRLL